MGEFRRFFQAILALLGLLALVAGISLFVYIPYLTDFVNLHIRSNYWLSMLVVGLLIVVGLYCLVALIHGIFAPSKKRRTIIRDQAGDIRISRDVLASAALDGVRQVRDVKRPSVEVEMKANLADAKVDVYGEVDQDKDVAAIANHAQGKVQAALQEALGQSLSRVNINITKYDSSELATQTSVNRGARVK
ncbi:hypothetical protein AWM75_06290 [Aerococcus urinaehominis]|uniref:Uncharacterized protein n=1 Tax=Aerococcus urinaehominis TaxID=128944 RepID=A0A0X8FLQ3_9LACT|nr:alkaline shock response membrane anchor protein AmaP [Aerococcus urinaehominis]AMB99614.1 hypothetical protein AWM75_06290 [Aerococcus urinaehominis]SDL87481.1 hypothetical protein SAMN04487985_10256 [Aerococcus urinaehominis]